jgi:hypothetical protein
MSTMTRGSILEEMFDDATDHLGRPDRAELAARLEMYKEKALGSLREGNEGRTWLTTDQDGNRIMRKGVHPGKQLERIDTLAKGLSADQTAALGGDLDALRQYLAAEVTKDWTPSNPVGGTGLTPYDLRPQAIVLVPRYTPIRNSVPREQGQGNALKYKRILSFTNAGIPGGAATQRITFNSLTATSTYGGTGNLTLARPAKISYTGDDHSVGYVELGVSDSVEWVAQFQGLGFDDLRALSHTALLWSHLMGEERQMLYGRGTGSGYAGVVSAPTQAAVATSATGGSIGAGTYSCYITANTGFGESLPSAVQTTGALSGSTNKITLSLSVEPTGALNYNVYVGTSVGIANAHFQGTFVPTNVAGVPTIVLTTYNSTSAIAGNVDTSAVATDYDGFLTIQSDPTQSGYLSRVNGLWSTTSPGSEIDLALQTMWTNNGADPEEIWMTGAARTEYGQLMRVGGASGAASGYRTNVVTGDGTAIIGTAVTGHVNPATQRVVSVGAHRFMPAGAVLIRSLTVPVQDSRITAPVVARNVQDYMAVDWPQIQLTYDASTYQIGTLAHYAPAWNGLLLGVN